MEQMYNNCQLILLRANIIWLLLLEEPVYQEIKPQLNFNIDKQSKSKTALDTIDTTHNFFYESPMDLQQHQNNGFDESESMGPCPNGQQHI